MSRYTGSVCRQCRREGTKLFLKGERCYTPKCALERHNYAPGQHGKARARFSEYRTQLRAKQRVKRHYGVLEKQFRRYFAEADRRKGITGENLLQLLETRLDNVVYRLGFARSRKEARQVVRHKHISVNGRSVNVPSFQVRAGDEIVLSKKSVDHVGINMSIEFSQRLDMMPPWLNIDYSAKKGEVKSLPLREDITMDFDEQLIVELYSK